MNWVELQADWKRAGPLLKSYWTKLTDRDVERIGGRRNNLASSLQQHYPYGEDEVERAICEFEKDVRFPGAVK